MSERKQGFDPLASLFEVPNSSTEFEARPQPPGFGDLAAEEELTEVMQPEGGEHMDSAVVPDDVTEVTEIDPVAIAKALGRVAAEKAGSPVSIQQKRGKGAQDERLANLAEDAISRRVPAPRDDGVAAFLNRVPKVDPDAEKAPRYGVRRSRTESIAARARAPVEALEAARIAQEREERAFKEMQIVETRVRQEEMVNRVQQMLSRVLPKSGAIYVANALQVEDRDVQRAIWRSHRARFLSDGALERAVGAAAVLHALEVVSSEALVAAYVVTDASDYLVWIDLDQDTVLAAFSDARSYFAAQSSGGGA